MSNSELREQIKQVDVEKSKRLLTGSWWHSIDLGDGRVTPGVNSLDELRQRYLSMGLPEDLTGRTLLDIGCWDGFFSFEAERHGARVSSVDCVTSPNFSVACEALKSNAEFHELSVYDVTKERLGAFDIVLFLGVLYHVRHPLLALEQVCEVTRDFAIIESHVIDKLHEGAEPAMEFYEFDELGGQYDNWWAPNVECMVKMTRSAGFARVELLNQTETRATIKAYRKWNNKPASRSAELMIRDVFNAITYDRYFPKSGSKAFISLWVEGLPKTAQRWEIRVEVGGFGSHPIYVGPPGDPTFSHLTQINVPVPPGLEPGKTSVCVWHDGKLSNEFEIQLVDAGRW